MLSDIESDNENDEGAMTAGEVLNKLEEAWLNEKFSPEILDNKSEVVDCMLEQIFEMEENIKRAKKGDFKISVHRMEINRIKFVVASYLRQRLKKIEKHFLYILTNPKECNKLTPQEFAYAKEFQENFGNHMTALALRHMPSSLSKIDEKKLAHAPNLDSYVFMRVNQNSDGILVEEETVESREEIIDLEKADQHIIRYRPIADLISDGTVTLM